MVFMLITVACFLIYNSSWNHFCSSGVDQDVLVSSRCWWISKSNSRTPTGRLTCTER